jgi:IS1 family transposase
MTKVQQKVLMSARKKNWVWNYFDEKTDGRVYCTFEDCEKSFKGSKQTSFMKAHLITIHGLRGI